MGKPSFRPWMRRSCFLPTPAKEVLAPESGGLWSVCCGGQMRGWEDSCAGTSELTFTGLSGTFWIWLAPGVPSTRCDEGTVTLTHFTNGDVLARYRGRSCDSPSGHESSPEAGLCHCVLLGSPGTQQGRPWVVRQSRAREQGHEGCPSASAGWRVPWAPTAVPQAPVRKSWVGTVTATAFQNWEGRAGQLEASR